MDRAFPIHTDGIVLEGELTIPAGARGLVVFAHGTGSSRLSPRNRSVAAHLRGSGHFGTLLFDLLTPEEDLRYRNRFEIGLLADRLVTATRAVTGDPDARGLPIGYFGASTGAAAALQAAVRLPDVVTCVVSRGGRPDLAGDALPEVTVPTLLIVGGADDAVLSLNQTALAALGTATRDLKIVPGATHLFDEPGAIEQVADLTAAWFERYLGT